VIDVEGGWADLGSFIKAQRDAAQMSVRRLAELAGVSNPYLSQIERGLRKPSADILQQLARALRISAETLYMRAGILDPDANTDNAVIEAIAVDPRLTGDQRKSLITIYESFRAQNGGAAGATSSPPPPAPPAPPPSPAPPTKTAKASAGAASSRAADGESTRAGKR